MKLDKVEEKPQTKSRFKSKTYWALAVIAWALVQALLPPEALAYVKEAIDKLFSSEGLTAAGLGLAVFGQEDRSLPFKDLFARFRREENHGRQ